MSRTDEINFPPEEIYNQSGLGKKNWSHIILWMLKNNDIVEWSDFKKDPVNIAQSTLSNYLNKLDSKGYLERIKRGFYKITSKGEEKYNELSRSNEVKRKLSFPPDAIKVSRNYNHIILWMAYNNNSLKWADFTTEGTPVRINQSSLSKNVNLLLDNKFLKKNENKEYKITQAGKSEYSRMLKLYDLDRQSILEEESKRIEEITEKTSQFFEEFEVKNSEVKFRFLNNVLKLDYSKVKDLLDEEDFNKILLFLSLNHPNQYPQYLTPKEFSLNYNIDETTLKYYVNKVVDENYFSIKFFKLAAENERVYYFQADEKLEKILRAIVEDHITKFTYLNCISSTPLKETAPINIIQILDNILEDICNNLFNRKLEPPLKVFLPKYIKYLAYKIESEKKLINSRDRMESLAYLNISDEFRTFNGALDQQSVEDYYYNLYSGVFEALSPYYLSKISFMRTNEFIEQYFSFENQQIIAKIENILTQGKISKALSIYEKNKGNFKELEDIIVNDIITTLQGNLKDSIKITSQIIEKYPKAYIGYLLQSLTYFEMNEVKMASEIIEAGIKISNNPFLICQKVQILILNVFYDEALETVEEALGENPNHVYLLRTKSLLYTLRKESYYDNPNAPLDLIDSAIKLEPDNFEILILKAFILCYKKKYKKAKKFLNQEIGFNIFTKNPRIDTAAFFTLVYSYIARGKFEKALEMSNMVLMHYPNHPVSYLTKTLVFGYNLIYKFQKADEDSFLNYFEQTISRDSNKHHQARYLQFKSSVFYSIKGYEGTLNIIEEALELSPMSKFLHNSKIHLFQTTGNYDKALAFIEELFQKMPKEKKRLLHLKSFTLYDIGKYEEALKILDDLISQYPNDFGLLNNKAYIQAHLNDKEGSIESIKTLIKNKPNDGNAHDSFGEILMMFNEYENAITELQIALDMEPNGFFAYQSHLKMGKCYEKLGIYDLAEEKYNHGMLLTEKMLPEWKSKYEYQAEKLLLDLQNLKERL